MQILALASTGCGKKRKKRPQENVRRTILSSRLPAQYELEDTTCQRQSDFVPIESSKIWGFQPGQGISPFYGRFQRTTSQDSIVSDNVLATFFGKIFREKCEQGSDIHHTECTMADNGTALELAGGPEGYLRACKNSHEYGRQTYEQVALAGVYYLDAAAQAHVAATNQKLPPVNLETLPTYESRRENLQTEDGEKYDAQFFITDNLAYSPLEGSVIIFPQSQDFYERQSPRFWESPFVFNHEYGHHIESQIFRDDYRRMGLEWSWLHHSFVPVSALAPENTFGDDIRQLQTARVWSAISEAFADLVSVYASPVNLFDLQQLYCLNRNRDVTRPYFADQIQRKALTLSAIQQLAYGMATSVPDCNGVDFSDPHHVGAVIAHGLFQIFRIAIPGAQKTQNSEDTAILLSHERYRALIQWRRHLHTATSQINEPLEIFNVLGSVMESTFPNIESAEIRQQVCLIHRDIFPVVKNAPFAQDCARENKSFNNSTAQKPNGTSYR